jgi:hypothetical protein
LLLPSGFRKLAALAMMGPLAAKAGVSQTECRSEAADEKRTMMVQSRDLTVAQEGRLFDGVAVQPFSAAVLGFIAFPLIEFTRRGPKGRGIADPMRAEQSWGRE